MILAKRDVRYSDPNRRYILEIQGEIGQCPAEEAARLASRHLDALLEEILCAEVLAKPAASG